VALSVSEIYWSSDRRFSAKLVPNLKIAVVTWSAQRMPTAVNLESLFFHSSSSSIIFTRLSGPVPTHYFSENLVALGIEPGLCGSVARNSDHRTTEAVIHFNNIFTSTSRSSCRSLSFGFYNKITACIPLFANAWYMSRTFPPPPFRT
jgi:hypothetical protein